jgi:16S rRNA (guanine527-N7)-methyltransferase
VQTGRGSAVSRAGETLASGARSILGRPLTDPETESFDKYLKLLKKWQKVQRLIGSTDSEWIVENLFLDSLLFLRVLPREIESIADLGSGAGLPGIPIKIARPDIAVALIESRERRVSFLSTVLRELGLQGIRVLNGRAEEIAAATPQSFTAVVMRCAGDPTEVVPVAARLVVPRGFIVVAGSPTKRPLAAGQWVEVPGIRPGRTRSFVVHRT